MFNKKYLYLLYYMIGALVIMTLLNTFLLDRIGTREISYSTFENMLNDNLISQISIEENRILIAPKKEAGINHLLYTGKINDPNFIEKLNASGVEFSAEIPDERKGFFVEWILPILIFGIFWMVLSRLMQKRAGSGVMSFGKNNAKIYAQKETGVTFNDVAGQTEAKDSLLEIVDFLHNPDKYGEIGASLPKGALLVGPPGTGKTLLAKAVAGEANVPFFSISASEFVEMFVGVGASRIRDLFKQAEEKAPCIVFIDEIDAIGKSRDNVMGGNDEREQTLNQLLAEMDGFDSSKGVVILAATNRPEILDKALLRPGRFDRRIIVDKPDLLGREAILKVHLRKVKVEEDIDIRSVAQSTPGASGAELANIVNEAALNAVRNKRLKVALSDLEESVETVIAGARKQTMVSRKEREMVSFHEIGHALVAALTKNAEPVHKITIVPRTMGALGYTMQLPQEEKYLLTKEDMLNEITIMMGGRAAEEVKYGTISTGASNDIERATSTARSMVTIYGMSDKFGNMALESISNRYLDGRPVQNCSPETAATIDEEVRKILEEAYVRALDLLKENTILMEKAAAKLLEQETLTGEEFMKILFDTNKVLSER